MSVIIVTLNNTPFYNFHGNFILQYAELMIHKAPNIGEISRGLNCMIKELTIKICIDKNSNY